MKIKSSKESFIDILNEQSGLGETDTFALDDIVFRDGHKLNNGLNSIWLCLKNDSPENCVQVNFEKICIPDILGMDLLILDLYDPTPQTIREAIAVNYRWDVSIEDYLVVKISEDRYGSKWEVIPTKENLLFKGSVEIHVRPLNKILDRTVRTFLDVHTYFRTNENNDRPDVSYIFKPKSPSKEFDVLLKGLKADQVALEDAVGKDLVKLAKNLTNDNWVSVGAVTEFNLYNARIIYNGLNTGKFFSGSRQHSHVLVIELSEFCSNLKGQWSIPYFSKAWNATYPFAIRGNVILDED